MQDCNAIDDAAAHDRLSHRGVRAPLRAMREEVRDRIEELVAEGVKVAAQLIYSGTHRGELFGIPGTGRKIAYQGLALFRFQEGKIVTGFVLGDTETLKRQLAQK